MLLVDDVEANLALLHAQLADEACSLTEVSSGRRALEELSQHDYALVLLDVQMPDMDGYEVARRAREHPRARDVPIIFLTATHGSAAAQLVGYGSGAVDFLLKPVQSEVLLGKVRVFIELYGARRKLALANAALELKNRELEALAEAERATSALLRDANQRLESAYHELQAAQLQLVQAAKMASLGELVAGVAHEINNPLAFVLSHLATVEKSLVLIRRDGPAASEQLEPHWLKVQARLSDVQLGLERMRDLVLKLRTFSRLDEGQRKRVNVAESVDSVCTILAHRLGERIRLLQQLGPPEEIECSPGLLNQALLNLVTNAIDAIDGSGTITIKAGSEGAHFVLEVADTGRGIPAEVRERVLDPFFTTKPVGEGTGLGLSIAYAIVQQHQGTLELCDAPGGGTLATIRLPL